MFLSFHDKHCRVEDTRAFIGDREGVKREVGQEEEEKGRKMNEDEGGKRPKQLKSFIYTAKICIIKNNFSFCFFYSKSLHIP